MDSLGEECTPLKAKYDDCFNAWFRDSFLRGKTDHDQVCGELFKAYQQCLKVQGGAQTDLVNHVDLILFSPFECLQVAMERQNLNTEQLHENILETGKEKKEP